MIELERHIEILLLSNDCVIVPHLGGFMTHHVEARYDEGDNMFLPPLRTLGFNPQLNINDSLLAQSYIEAYDISYPEALQRIEDEVCELKMHLQNEGTYELNDIGELSLNEDGHYVFTPCEAGILTPTLYGLSSFEMRRLAVARPAEQPAIQPTASPIEPREEAEQPKAQIIHIDEDVPTGADNEEEEADNDVVKIKFSWIRNTVAAAAILLAVCLLALPTGKTEMMTRTISNINNGLLFGMMSKDTNTSKIELKKIDIENSHDVLSYKDSTSLQAPIAKADSTPAQPATTTRQGYCIVLASYVTQQNARLFVEKLQKKGYEQSEVYIHNDVTRVIFGNYPTQQEAYNDLRKIHQNEELAEAWVYKFN